MAGTNRFALVIGIDAYGNGIPQLGSAVKDAQAVADKLTNEHGYAVTSLLDADANVAAITQFLDQQIPPELSVDTPFLMYFAGHGVAEGETGAQGPQGYLVLHDAELAKPETWLPMDTLRKALNALTCRHLLVVLDCCYAGAFRWATATRDIGFLQPPTLYQSVYDRYMSGEAWQVLTSAAANQVAADAVTGFANLRGANDQGHSPFAAALIDGLAGGADTSTASFGADGVITATELYQYISTCLMPSPDAATAQTPGIWPLKPDNAGEYVFLNPKVKLQTRPDPPLDDSNNPWLGLEAYSAATSALFFGRQAVTDELLARVEARGKTGSLLAVVGASGTGKSSLVHAGLLPSLGARRWAVVQSAPLTGDPTSALEDARKALAAAPRGRRRLLVIDQLEDLYTQCPDGAARAGFLKGLHELIDAPSGPTVVVTLRSDFELRAVDDESLKDIWQAARYQVPPFSSDELREVLEGPTRVKAMYFDPADVEDDLFDEVNAMPGALPLLSFALAEIYRQSQLRRQKSGSGDRALSRADYEAVGGVTGALNRRATQLYDAADDTDKMMIERVFLRLVSQDGSGLTRRRVDRAELQFGIDDDDVQQCVDRVVNSYVGAGLLVVGSDAGGDFVEPAHDALIIDWQDLHDWLQESGSQDVIRAAWSAADNWASKDARSTTSGYLWNNDPRLPQLTASRQEGDLNTLERAFEATSTRRKKLRTRRLITLTAMIMTALAVFALYARYQRSVAQTQRDHATSLLLATIAGQQVNTHLDDSMLLGLDAISARPTAQSESAMLSALETTRRSGVTATLNDPDSQGVSGVAFSPDGSTLAAADANGTVVLWNTLTHTLLGQLADPKTKGVADVAFSPDGSTLAAADHNGRVVLWNTRTHALLGQLADPKSQGVSRVAFSPDGGMLAALDANGNVVLWNTRTLALLHELTDPRSQGISGIAFSPVGSTLAAADLNGNVVLWNTRIGAPRGQLTDPKSPGVSGVAFSPTGNTLAAADGNGRVVVWSTRTDHQLRTLNAPDSQVVYGVAFSSNGSTLATADHAGRVVLWNTGTYVPRRELDDPNSQGVSSVAFSPVGGTLAAADYNGTLVLWNASPHVLLGHLDDPKSKGVSGVAFSANGGTLAAADGNGKVVLWDTRTHTLLHQFPDPKSQGIKGVAFSPDGSILAAADGNGKVVLWSTRTHAVLHQFADPKSQGVYGVAFSPDGSTVAAADGNGRVVLWSTRTHAVLHQFADPKSQGVSGVAFSPDGSIFAAADYDGAVVLWNARTYGLLGRLEDPKSQGISGVAFSPDGSTLAAADHNGAVVLWNTRTYALLGQLNDPKSQDASGLAFNLDGSTLAAADHNGAVVLWDTRTRSLLGRLDDRNSQEVSGVAFSPDGRTLAAADGSGKVVLWNGLFWQNFAELRSMVCSIVWGDLTKRQWEALVPGVAYRTTCPN